jgi:hypothetical protein
VYCRQQGGGCLAAPQQLFYPQVWSNATNLSTLPGVVSALVRAQPAPARTQAPSSLLPLLQASITTVALCEVGRPQNT